MWRREAGTPPTGGAVIRRLTWSTSRRHRAAQGSGKMELLLLQNPQGMSLAVIFISCAPASEQDVRCQPAVAAPHSVAFDPNFEPTVIVSISLETLQEYHRLARISCSGPACTTAADDRRPSRCV